MRTKREISSTTTAYTYKYYYNGSSLSRMTKGTDVLDFIYGADGTPTAVVYNGTYYYYVTNLQGDVVALLDSSGNTVVSYTYDAWGKPISTTGSMASTLGTINPLRYRGYVYDTETGFYYLQSRYYDPTIGRFLNADAFASTGQGLLGNNMFAYCNNNPLNFVDSGGRIPRELSISPFAICSDGGGGGFRSAGGACIPVNYTDIGPNSPWSFVFNDDEYKVIKAEKFAFYKGQLVIKQDWGITEGCSFSFIIMFLHKQETDINTVKHEYGHFLQLKKYGLLKYTASVAVPSVIFNKIDSKHPLPWGYYNSPWEYESDHLADVTRKEHTELARRVSDVYSRIIGLYP